VTALSSTLRARKRAEGSGRRWLPAVVLGLLILATFAVSKGCQPSQIRLTKEQAISKAEAQINFEPTRVQVRMLRQGIGSHPFWIVSLSIPKGDSGQVFKKLAVVRIDANTGKVADVRVQR
jgi:hypothetical protein